MTYRIIITSNNKKKKILHKSNNISSIKKKYFQIKDKNKVLYPKQTSSYLKTKPIKYELILMKEWKYDDTPFIGRDNLGRTIENRDINKKWTIIHKSDFFYEETFKVFNFTNRLDCKDIIKKILMRKQGENNIKQVNYVKNKLMIHQDGDFDLVLCKCPLDSEKLYGVLKKFAENNNINNILFTGDIKLDKTEIYNMIANKTGWDKNKVYRTVTRP